MREGLSAQILSRVLASRWLSEDLEIRPADTGEYAAATGSALAVLDRAIADPNSTLWGE
jgi:hypothetical protein